MAGCDLVGMSTVPEVIVAARLGMRVLALSVVTNVCRPDHSARTQGDDVVSVATDAEPRVRDIIVGVLASEKTAESAVNGSRGVAER
jgi:purine-nucleoside phosphorylase